jgi:hypothetical protein
MVATFIHYIDFGCRDQVSELPIVMRAMEPDFLPHDFYTNTASPYGTRYFYAKFLALRTDRASLPFWAFLLTLLINIAIGVAWYFWQSKRPQYRDLARALRSAALATDPWPGPPGAA